jgi:hypothetical protein
MLIVANFLFLLCMFDAELFILAMIYSYISKFIKKITCK